MRPMAILVGGLLLAGAASADTRQEWSIAKGQVWSLSKANTRASEFYMDDAWCAQASQKSYSFMNYAYDDAQGTPVYHTVYRSEFDTSAFLSCMSDKGYRIDANGNGPFTCRVINPRWRLSCN
jgi:hypothetical protein